MKIHKRDGRLVVWDMEKVLSAVTKAMVAADMPENRAETWEVVKLRVEELIKLNERRGVVDIEQVQDVVEDALMGIAPAVGKVYIAYRRNRAMVRRRMELLPDPNMVADYIHPAKYSRWLKSEKRREIYLETSHRTRDMHITKYPAMEEKIRYYWKWVDEKCVLPSMRSLQFGGVRALEHNASIYNCSFTLVDRPRVFGEIFYLLLCGCGVGASVRKKHVSKLPKIRVVDRGKVRHHTVVDNIEGWSDVINALIDSAMEGYWLEVDYSRIRPEGTPLESSGGVAPGHIPLRDCVEKLREILAGAVGRHLKPIECGDMISFIAMAVLSGGIRRSSLILIFSPDDEEMLTAKSVGNFRYPNGADPGLNPQRAMSNNSAGWNRSKITEQEYYRLFDEAMANYGDPGVAFFEDDDDGGNPCMEIGLRPWITTSQLMTLVDEGLVPEVGEWAWELMPEAERRGMDYRHSGFAFCNLCEINGAKCRDAGDFFFAAEAAAFIGTLQAGYTDFRYLGPITEAIARREALLGVGMTGMMDNPAVCLNATVVRTGAEIVVENNRLVAKMIGIRQASRCTTVKPSGTASLELGCVGSGIHPHHAGRYFRRVTANKNESVAQYLYKTNPHLFELKPNGDWCITFPIAAPVGAVTVKDQDARHFLENVFSTYDNWILPGTALPERAPGLTHNVSATVTGRPDEWPDIRKMCWDNRARINSMSFANVFNDKLVPFMPREEVTTELDWLRWEELITKYVNPEYVNMVEDSDGTAQALEAACGGGACDIVEGVGMMSGCVMPGCEMLFNERNVFVSPWAEDVGREFVRDARGDLFELVGERGRTVCGQEYRWGRAIRGLEARKWAGEGSE